MTVRSVLILLSAAGICRCDVVHRCRAARIRLPASLALDRQTRRRSGFRHDHPALPQEILHRLPQGREAEGRRLARRLPERGPRPQGPQELARGAARPRGRRDAARRRKPQPTKAETRVRPQLDRRTRSPRSTAAARKDPGRVTIRRLNRAEYNNTIRDLCGVDFKPGRRLPRRRRRLRLRQHRRRAVLPADPARKVHGRRRQGPRPRPCKLRAVAPRATSRRFQPQNILGHPAQRQDRRRPRSQIVFTSEGLGVPARSSTSRPTASTSSASAAGARRSAAKYPKVAVRVDGKDVKTLHRRSAEQDKAARPTRSTARVHGRREARRGRVHQRLRGQGRTRRSASSALESHRDRGAAQRRGRRPIPASVKLLLDRPAEAPRTRGTGRRRC